MPKPHSTGGRNFLQKAIFAGAGLPCMGSTLALQTVSAAAPEAARSTRRQGAAEWVINNCYRMPVVEDPGADKGVETPVSVQLDFAEIFKSHGIRGRLDQNSIRVARYDPSSGPALTYEPNRFGYQAPYPLGGEFVVEWNGEGRKDLIISGESGWVYLLRAVLEGSLPQSNTGSLETRPQH